MSYILESLKKSEKERREQAIDSPIDQVYDSTLLDNPESESHKKKHHFMIFLIVLLAAVIVGTVVMLMNMSGSTDPIVSQTSMVKNNTNSPDLEDSTAKSKKIDKLYQQLEREKQQAREKIKQAKLEKKTSIESAKVEIVGNNEENTKEKNKEKNKEKSEQVADITSAQNTPLKKAKDDQLIIPSFNQLSMLSKDNLPTINYSAHVFAEDNRNGFVVINGQKQRSGSKLSNGIYLEKIEQDAIILSYDGLVFKMPAMTSWINN